MAEATDALFEEWWARDLDVGEWDESGWKPASTVLAAADAIEAGEHRKP